MKEMKEYALPLLCISLGIVFLYFGFQQISNPDDWTGFIPDFLTGEKITANNIVIFNGIMELTLGIFLIIGLYVKFSSLILSIHLFIIALSIGFNPLGMRDFGLAAATLVIFLLSNKNYGVDAWFENRMES